MLGDAERLRLISQNLANVGTTGYRAEVLLSDSLDFARLMDGDTKMVTDLWASGRDNRQGALSHTERTLDFALEGRGYFQISTPDGIRYTRRGDFKIDPLGRLLTTSGHPVVGTGGEIVLRSENIRVDSLGRFFDEEQLINQFSLALFEDERAMAYEETGLYRSSDAPLLDFNGNEVKIKQGYLEAANVQPVQEMVRMIETVRHFGLAAQAVKAYDQMMDSAINDAGQF
jgi:flagellar basal-body rod protein FlgG